MPGPVSRTATVNDRSSAEALIVDFARVGELDGIADQVQQDLRDAPLVAASRRQMRRHFGFEYQVLFAAASGSTALTDAVDDLLDRIVGQRQRELTGLDLGQVEHVVDEPEKMPAVALDALEHGGASCPAVSP